METEQVEVQQVAPDAAKTQVPVQEQQKPPEQKIVLVEKAPEKKPPITSEDFEKPITQKDADEHFIHLNMLTGDGRFIIALLSLLNAQITTAERVIPNPKIIHTQFLKRVPRNEYKVLSINLSEKHIRKVYKSRSTNIKQKQHHRRGHWRHYKSGKKTWINNYLAGDPNLGKIVKDYNFKMEIKNGE